MRALPRVVLVQLVWVALGHSNMGPLRPFYDEPADYEEDYRWQSKFYDYDASIPLVAAELSAPPKKPSVQFTTIDIRRFHVTSHIEHRYAHTEVSSTVYNHKMFPVTTTYKLGVPETAFISSLLLEAGGKTYKASVCELQESQLSEAPPSTLYVSPDTFVCSPFPNTKYFELQLRLEPQTEVTLNLTYEELLVRKQGVYNHLITINPGQVVHDLRMDVYIKEKMNITTLKIPEPSFDAESDTNKSTAASGMIQIKRPSGREAHISFNPSLTEQLYDFPKLLNRSESENQLFRQILVQYDVDRADESGELLVENGYFVQFLSPPEPPLQPSHVIVLLDVSSAASGPRGSQMGQAVQTILNSLREDDVFSLMKVKLSNEMDKTNQKSKTQTWYRDDDTDVGINFTFPFNNTEAKHALHHLDSMSVTKVSGLGEAFQMALNLAHKSQANSTEDEDDEDEETPLIVFLTAGPAPPGRTGRDILAKVKELNTDPEVPIFSLALGDDADFDFLRKLSMGNSGFARKISWIADMAETLQDFYKQTSSPMLENITFAYPLQKIETEATTKDSFPVLVRGSEIVVAGKMKPSDAHNITDLEFEGLILVEDLAGEAIFALSDPIRLLHMEVQSPVTTLERLWAFLSIKQLLIQIEKEERNNSMSDEETRSQRYNRLARIESLKENVLDLSLKYSFETRFTSLNFIKPTTIKKCEAPRPEDMTSDDFLASFYLPSQDTQNSTQSTSTAGLSGDDIQYNFNFELTETSVKRKKPRTIQEPSGPPRPHIVPFEELTWLDTFTNDARTLIYLPFYPASMKRLYRLEKINKFQPPVQSSSCENKGGVCLHLSHCPLKLFKDDINIYRDYFCAIGDFAGVCCPGYLIAVRT